MATLSAPGIGSGLDVNGIVDQLVALERRPITQLQTANTRLTTQLSTFGQLQSQLSTLQGAAASMAKASSWARNAATSSDAASVTAFAKDTAVGGTYSVTVSQLASSHSLSTAVFADPSDIGTGTLNITVGGSTVSIDVLSGANSLSQVRDQINQANAGVSATLIHDGTGSRLVLTAAQSGAANAIHISVSGGTGALNSLDSASLTMGRAALDALFTVNGIPLTSPSNRLDGVVDGLDLTLKKVTTTPIDIGVSPDIEALKKDITAFVDAYNEINKFLSAQTKYEAATNTPGALQGDRTAVSLQGRLRAQYHQESTASAVFTRLSDIGVSMQRDGSLKIDDTKLAAALANPAELGKAFSTVGTGLAHGFKAIADGMVNGVDGALKSRTDSIRDRIRRNEQDQDRLEARVERTRLRLLRQYQALDTTVNSMNGLSSLVSQQMAMLQSNTTGGNG